ncbi:MAG: hypothetical protein GDA49_12440 [Rhodospirillales bacterium]|nr:hypothetical protein [Rhodospirillales bacterium]
MFGSSPIETWEGASVVYSYAGTSWVYIFFIIAVLLCIGTIIVSIKAENEAEEKCRQHMTRQKKGGGGS